MPRYLEYDKNTGRIICEIVSAKKPKTTENLELLEISEEQVIDTSLYAVRDGKLVRLYETNEERFERERLRKENAERTRERVKTMFYEGMMALLDDNESAFKALQREFKEIKVYL